MKKMVCSILGGLCGVMINSSPLSLQELSLQYLVRYAPNDPNYSAQEPHDIFTEKVVMCASLEQAYKNEHPYGDVVMPNGVIDDDEQEQHRHVITKDTLIEYFAYAQRLGYTQACEVYTTLLGLIPLTDDNVMHRLYSAQVFGMRDEEQRCREYIGDDSCFEDFCHSVGAVGFTQEEREVARDRPVWWMLQSIGTDVNRIACITTRATLNAFAQEKKRRERYQVVMEQVRAGVLLRHFEAPTGPTSIWE